jgi:2-polyprenyl-3-methyl-5-hydroxy-6-metoxy-1,4-benzoquinol methylase
MDKSRDGLKKRAIKGMNSRTGVLVDTLDCQCAIVHSSLVEKYNLCFDENLKFDLYIEDFCINAKINHDIESNILNINCCHHSIIDNMDERPSYFKMLKYFNKKYKDHIFSGTVGLIGGKANKCRANIISPEIKHLKGEGTGYNVRVAAENDPRRFSIDWIANTGTPQILDVGCACGDTGVALKNEKNCELFAFEYDKDSIETAQKTNAYKEIHQIDLNLFETESFPQYFEKFDYIILGDVLEHLYSPQKTLEKLKSYLKKDGYFLISLPNLSHASIKSNLLLNDFTYTEVGLLDKTHIRFFTHKSILFFLTEINLVIEEIKFTITNPRGQQPFNALKYLDKKSITTKKFILDDPYSYVCQFVMKVKPGNTNKILEVFEHNREMLNKDKDIWKSVKKHYKPITFLQQLFSIRNEYGRKNRKVIRILGIKIKLKNRKK